MILEQIISELEERLRERVLTLFGHTLERVVLQIPPRLSMGDLATPISLELAKIAKMPPRQIAQTLVEGLELPKLVSSASIEGAGYINFRFDRPQFVIALLELDSRRLRAEHLERVIVEHTNINPNKAAHIGHLRNAVIGDTLVRCLRWLGHTVETQNYIDDTGVQVADVVVGFERLLEETAEMVQRRIESGEVRFDYFCWDLYARMGQLYATRPEAVEWQRETLHRIEKREGETAQLGAMVAKAIVRRHIATALRLDIEYDLLVKESDIIALRFWDRAFELLKTSGAAVLETTGKNAGCWIMRLSETAEFEGLEEPDKVLVRSNGTVTYVGKDIAYQLWKFGLIDRTFGFQEFSRYADERVLWETTSHENANALAPEFGQASLVYNVIDIRQAYLQKVVREGLRLLGYPGEADRSIHFSYEMVALTPATAVALGINVSVEDSSKAFLEMSGRKGVGVKADDLMDALEAKALESVRAGLLRRGNEDEPAASDEELRPLAREIAVGSLRYFMLKFGRNKVIAFDFEEALSFEGDSGPYLQYSTVRADNIFRKMEARGVQSGLDRIDDLTLAAGIPDEIWEIVHLSAQTPAAVRRATESLELSILAHHALELAQKFNSFYHGSSILNEPDETVRRQRAACTEIFRRTLRHVMQLMGIPVPARM